MSERPPPSTGEPPVIKHGQLHKQAADGSCLYHAINYGLGKLGLDAPGAAALRTSLASWAGSHGNLRLDGKLLSDWVCWETGGSETQEACILRCRPWADGVVGGSVDRHL